MFLLCREWAWGTARRCRGGIMERNFSSRGKKKREEGIEEKRARLLEGSYDWRRCLFQTCGSFFEFVIDYRPPRDILERFEWYLKNWRGNLYGCIGEIWKGGIGWEVNRNEKLFLKFDSRDSFAEEGFLYRDLARSSVHKSEFPWLLDLYTCSER